MMVGGHSRRVWHATVRPGPRVGCGTPRAQPARAPPDAERTLRKLKDSVRCRAGGWRSGLVQAAPRARYRQLGRCDQAVRITATAGGPSAPQHRPGRRITRPASRTR
jgi:hypothetical protein